MIEDNLIFNNHIIVMNLIYDKVNEELKRIDNIYSNKVADKVISIVNKSNLKNLNDIDNVFIELDHDFSLNKDLVKIELILRDNFKIVKMRIKIILLDKFYK